MRLVGDAGGRCGSGFDRSLNGCWMSNFTKKVSSRCGTKWLVSVMAVCVAFDGLALITMVPKISAVHFSGNNHLVDADEEGRPRINLSNSISSRETGNVNTVQLKSTEAVSNKVEHDKNSSVKNPMVELKTKGTDISASNVELEIEGVMHFTKE